MMEFIERVDDYDRVIEIVPRDEASKMGYYVRIAATLVFNNEGKVVLQKVSHNKQKDPLKWSYSSAGHVNPGETYPTAALRELQEELGIKGEIEEYIGLSRTEDPCTGQKGSFHRVFKVLHNGPYRPDLSEIEDLHAFSIAELAQKIRKNPHHFKRNLIDILAVMGIK